MSLFPSYIKPLSDGVLNIFSGIQHDARFYNGQWHDTVAGDTQGYSRQTPASQYNLPFFIGVGLIGVALVIVLNKKK